MEFVWFISGMFAGAGIVGLTLVLAGFFPRERPVFENDEDPLAEMLRQDEAQRWRNGWPDRPVVKGRDTSLNEAPPNVPRSPRQF